MLVELKKHLHKSPKRIMLDFEASAIQAFGRAFPDATIKGCYFHFTQALWRNIQSKGLSKLYNNNNNVRFHLKIYKSIGFVPINNIDLASDFFENSLYHLITTESLPKTAIAELVQYHNYFKGTWLNNSMYPRKLWNHYESFTDRTNNNNEGFNNGLQQFIGVIHTSLYQLIDDLKAIETRVTASYINLKNGVNLVKKQKKIYKNRDQKISDLKQELKYSSISLKSFMVQTSYHYSYDKKVDSQLSLEINFKNPLFDNFFFFSQ